MKLWLCVKDTKRFTSITRKKRMRKRLPQNYQTRKVMEFKLPAKGIVGIVQRRNRILIPNGKTQVMSGDMLIIFTTSENAQIIREYFKVD